MKRAMRVLCTAIKDGTLSHQETLPSTDVGHVTFRVVGTDSTVMSTHPWHLMGAILWSF